MARNDAMATSKVSRSAKKTWRRAGSRRRKRKRRAGSSWRRISEARRDGWLLPGLARLGAVAAAAAVTAAVAIDVPLTKQANEYLQNAINTLYASALCSEHVFSFVLFLSPVGSLASRISLHSIYKLLISLRSLRFFAKIRRKQTKKKISIASN